MEIPAHLKGFQCSDYFSSESFIRGFYDEAAHLWTLYPARDLQEYPDLEFLAIGRPGVDGIEWGYRKGHPGLWAYVPIDGSFEHLAPSVAELLEGWLAGRIKI